MFAAREIRTAFEQKVGWTTVYGRTMKYKVIQKNKQ